MEEEFVENSILGQPGTTVKSPMDLTNVRQTGTQKECESVLC